jgi:hypothetical protein
MDDSETSEIYYLIEFQYKCVHVLRGSAKKAAEYCGFVNEQLQIHFTEEEQKQLQMYHFNEEMLNNFAFNIVYGIRFDNLDKIKLGAFFRNVCFTSPVKIKCF